MSRQECDYFCSWPTEHKILQLLRNNKNRINENFYAFENKPKFIKIKTIR